MTDDTKSSSKKIPVIEIFGPTIQGEGALCGFVSHFVRLGGCPYRCKWCDSLHAVLPEEIKKNATYMTQRELAAKVSALPESRWCTLTGGDPVMWDLTEFMHFLGEGNHSLTRPAINVETEGYLKQDWLLRCDLITVSPKVPALVWRTS